MASFQNRGGVWRAIVRRKGFKAKTRSFPTKSAARTWADRIERELADAEARGDKEMDACTLSELIDWYQAEVAQFSRVNATQRGNLTRIKEGLGHHQANAVTAHDVIEHAKRRRSGKHVGANGVVVPACSASTIAIELGYLGAVYKLAKGLKISMSHDPVTDARPRLRLAKVTGKSKKRERRPTYGELVRLKAHFDAAAWRSKIPMADIIDFAIASAKRESEITRLLRSDLDMKHRTALLRDAKHPRDKEGNHKRFALLGDAWEIVKRQPSVAGEDRIFPFKSKSVGTAFTRACKELGIKDLHFHDLRHEATSRLFEQGYSIEQVASVTLHESWTELKRYTQLKPEGLHRDINSHE